MMIEQARSAKVELLRQCINDENYMNAAIQRLALVMSKELMDMTQEEKHRERQRKRRK
jgi:hypothetical protein